MDDARRPAGSSDGPPEDGTTKDRTGSAGTWLGGVRSAGVDLGFAGQRLGLPARGSGSVAGYGRRLGALFIDWVIALVTVTVVAEVLGSQLSRGTLWPLAAFGIETWLLTGLLGRTIGKRICGLRVVRLDGRPVGPGWALARTALLLTVVPALLWDRDYRGLHDRAAGTVVIRV
jgi:uncharacterized RDD family membrane protein YckC